MSHNATACIATPTDGLMRRALDVSTYVKKINVDKVVRALLHYILADVKSMVTSTLIMNIKNKLQNI